MPGKQTLGRTLVAFSMASFATYSLASMLHSQFVLWELRRLGVALSAGPWLNMMWQDWLGLAPGYGSVIALTLGLGFILVNWLPLGSWRFIVGGGIAMAVMLLAMQPVLDITLIAGARTPLGFFSQCLAGLCGGWLFARLRSD